MTTLTSSTQQLIEEVVQQQRSSPAFPLFCITHVTDPKYQFLFQTTPTEMRSGYEDALHRAAHTATSNAAEDCASNDKSDNRSGCGGQATPHLSSSWPSVAKKPLLFIPEYISSVNSIRHPLLTLASSQDRFRISSAAEQRAPSGSSSFSFFLSLDDVERIWKELRSTFDVIASTGSSKGTRSIHRRFGNGHIFGPHAPHVFTSREALQHFIEDVLVAVAHESKEKVNAVVMFMLSRLPMTECFLLTLSYILQQLLYYVHENLTTMILLQRESQDRKKCTFFHSATGSAMKWSRRYGLKKRVSSASGQFIVHLMHDDDDGTDACGAEAVFEERPLQRFRTEAYHGEEEGTSTAPSGIGPFDIEEVVGMRPSVQKSSLSDGCDLLVSTMQCVEYAGAILYVMSHLLQLHRQREAEFESVTGARSEMSRRASPTAESQGSGGGFAAMNTNSHEADSSAASRVGDTYYGSAFQHYLLLVCRRMVHTLSSLGGCTPALTCASDKDVISNCEESQKSFMRQRGTLQLLLSSPAYTYLLQMMQIWGSERSWPESAREEWMALCQQLLSVQHPI